MKKNGLKCILSLLLALCLLLSGFTGAQAAQATTLYFLNTGGWQSVGAYIYGEKGELLGSWPGAVAESAPELGESWVKVSVSDAPAYSVIFFNTANDAQRTELYLSEAANVYVTASSGAFSTKAAAEQAAEVIAGTTVYYLNSEGWENVGAYVYGDAGEALGAWPGTDTAAAPELGGNWVKVTVPADPGFYIIFHEKSDTAETLRAEQQIADKSMIYVSGCKGSGNVAAYSSRADAEAAVKRAPGAALPYTTYEAEAMDTTGEILAKATAYRETVQSEASGRRAVKLDGVGEYVEFTLTEPANALVLRYSMPDSSNGAGIDATLSMYVDGKAYTDLSLTSRYAWVYGEFPYNNTPGNGNGHRFFDETRLLLDDTLPVGTTIRLQKDASDTAGHYIIDFVECELAAAPLTQPEGSLSVADYGAVPNDGKDDRAAFESCISAAKSQGKEVWIPAGTFDLTEERVITLDGVTIRGAGMWHTNLYGAGAAFKYQGTCRFFDFSMTGVSTVRDDGGDLAGIEGTGSAASNVIIQNIWMEHMKVGVWSVYTTDLVIQGCRIRNTYADGINLCSGTHNATVQNNSLRNTGDDAIAIWPWQADCTGNTIAHNTIQVPTLANGVAIYGGGNNTVDANHIADTINNGAGIAVGSEFDTSNGYTGAVTVQNNLLDRCGSMQTDENYPIGAIWLWASYHPMTNSYTVYNNTMNDCVREGILIECNSQLTGLEIRRNYINGATNGVYEYLNGSGSGTVGNLVMSGLTAGEYKDDAPNFNLTRDDDPDVAAAMGVDVRIRAIGEITDLVQTGDVEAARAAYEALTDSQKALVNDLAALEAAEAKIAELEAAPKPGDADNNGTVDSADMIALKNMILQNEWSGEALQLCDLNGNGKLDVVDIIKVKKIILSS